MQFLRPNVNFVESETDREVISANEYQYPKQSISEAKFEFKRDLETNKQTNKQTNQ